MSLDPPGDSRSLQLTIADHVDQECDRFEAAWRAGRQPRIEDYLAQAPEPTHPALFQELLALELELRASLGHTPGVHEYHERFPGQAQVVEAIFAQAQPRLFLGTQGAEVSFRPAGPAGGSVGAPTSSGRRFKILRPHARGGLGEVFLAHDEELDRDVALKQIQARHADDPSSRARFLLEAQVTGGLEHPGIVPVYGLGHGPDGRPFYAMRFVRGASLKEAIDKLYDDETRRRDPHQRELELRKLLGRLIDVCNAVAYAHSRGILHRDLKPSNVMLGPYGETLVVDWGLAKPIDRLSDPHGLTEETLRPSTDSGGSAPTQVGHALGTPAFMSPEQAAGQIDRLGAASDVYSLGATLYCMLTGHAPFETSSVTDILRRVREGEFPPPHRVKPNVPRALEAICLKAMALRPEERYGSPRLMAADIEQWLADEPVSAYREPWSTRLRRWGLRHRLLVTSAAVLLVAAVVALAAGNVLIGQQKRVAEANYAQAQRQWRRAQQNLSRALVGEARAQMQARDTGWWWKAMDNLATAASLPEANVDRRELRELAIQCLGTDALSVRLAGTWEGHGQVVSAVAISPDDRIAAAGSRDATIRLWSIPSGRPLGTLSGHTAPITGLAFLSGGRRLASCSEDGTVRLWDLEGLAQTAADSSGSRERPQASSLDLKAGQLCDLRLSPDGSLLGVACADGSVRLFRLPVQSTDQPGQTARVVPHHVLRGHRQQVNCIGFSPDGTRLASGSNDRTIRIWDVATGKPILSWVTANAPSSVAFAPNGEKLAWGDPALYGFLTRVLQNGTTASYADRHAGMVTQVGYDRSGRLFTASGDGSIRIWGNPFPQQVAIARGDYGAVLVAEATANGAWIVAGYADGRVRLWDVLNPPQRQFAEISSQSAAFVPGTKRLVSAWSSADLSQDVHAPWKPYGPALIGALVLSPDEASFAMGNNDGAIEVWNLAARKQLRRWQGHNRPITSLATRPDGTQLASASADGTVRLWSWSQHGLLRTLDPGLGPLHHVAWSSDGRHIAASGERGTALWDLEDADAPPRILAERMSLASAVALGPGVVALSGSDGAIEVRELNSGELRHRLVGHHNDVSALEFSPDGTKLASASGRDSARLWELSTGRKLAALEDSALGGTSLSFDPKGRYIATNSTSSPVLWDLQSKTVAAYSTTPGGCGRFLKQGAELLTTGGWGCVQLFTLARIERTLASARGIGQAVVATGAVQIHPSAIIVPGRHNDSVWCVTASPDGRWVATGAHDGTVKLWDASTLALVRTLTGHSSFVWSVAFSPDSRQLATGSREIRVWDVARGNVVHEFRDHKAIAGALAFHPQRPWLISGGDDLTVRIWDLSDGKPLGILHRSPQGTIHGVAIRPDGRWLAAARRDHHILVWDLTRITSITGPVEPDRTLDDHVGDVYSVAFSPDGRYLASGSDQGLIILWNGQTFDRVVNLRSTTGQVRRLSFTEDGNMLCGGTYASPAIIWDLAAVRRTLTEMNLNW